MKTTIVGYAFGTTASPTYYSIGDHAEAIRVEFDPAQTSYEDLLNRFFEWHNAFRKPYARQYMSAIMCHDAEQAAAVRRAVCEREDAVRKVRSEITDVGPFTWAEDYHQKYYLRRNKAVALEMKGRFPVYEDFVRSTAAARANACLGGYWQPQTEELVGLGFSEGVAAQLTERKKSFFGSLLGGMLG